MTHRQPPLLHPSPRPNTSASQLGFCPVRLQRLSAVLQAEVDRQRLPGVVALIARRGQTVMFESLGLQDPAKGTPMQVGSIFRVYSMTKPIVSVAAMMLVEQGRLQLADPVAKYLGAFAKQQVGTVVDGALHLHDVPQGATIHDLLRHTAGLTYEFMGSGPIQRRYAQARVAARDGSNAEHSQTLASLPLVAHPGSVFEYSRATDVLGHVLEVICGQTLYELLHQLILEPLGMTETWFTVPAQHHERIAEPFAKDPDGGLQMRMIDVRQHVARQSAGGGLASTAHDYARLLQCLLNRGQLEGVRLLSPHTVAFMTTDHLGSIPVNPGWSRDLLPLGYGFGLGFAVRLHAGVASVPGSIGSYYWGGLGGTTFFVDPLQDLFAILMVQAPNQREHYRMLFANLVYAALID
ncbi:MAG: serine hydrolase [Rhodoferax sp.]|nr:serine hydrolase [Rhodoferax sp.]MBK9236022.1 serine hydrolase [Rhodoferax sp.]